MQDPGGLFQLSHDLNMCTQTDENLKEDGRRLERKGKEREDGTQRTEKS
jgi:hypothetical protein